MNELLEEDTFIDIIKTHVRPAMDKVGSIRSQTAMYEKMERIPGGPTNFIETSMKTLDGIEDNELTRIEEEVLFLLYSYFLISCISN